MCYNISKVLQKNSWIQIWILRKTAGPNFWRCHCSFCLRNSHGHQWCGAHATNKNWSYDYKQYYGWNTCRSSMSFLVKYKNYGKNNLTAAISVRNTPYAYIIFNTDFLHKVFINYCSDVYRPLFLTIFRDCVSLSCIYVNEFGRSCTYMIKIIIKLKLTN